MSHPLEMSLSTSGWGIDPTLLDDLRIELFHSEQFGNSFIVKLKFKNGTEAKFEIAIEVGEEFDVYDALTAAIRIPRMAPVISGSGDVEATG